MSDYLLGHDDAEWARLEAQHALWASTLLGDLRLLGLGAGDRVLEVGCGTGALLRDLAEIVGPSGRVAAIERDPRAGEAVRQRLGVDVFTGDLYDVDPGDGWDWIVSRWVFSFLPDLDAAVTKLAGALAPGGTLVIQDYVHDGVRVFPALASFDRVIAGYRAAYAAGGGDLWVAGALPAAFSRADLQTTHIQPHAKAGPVGSGCWAWVERFLFAHIDTVLSGGHLEASEWATFKEEWQAFREVEGAILMSPMVVTVAGVKPRARP